MKPADSAPQQDIKKAPSGDQSYKKFRRWLGKQHSSVRVTYKIAIAVAGGIVIILGLIIVPLPGPGWLIVFMGLAILGLEFPAAKRVQIYVKKKAQALLAWYRARKENKKRQ
jgi:uncharacterized protein (TIGR02611 family)